jgi:fluoroacetyl-CoA thioesterase
VIDFIALLDGMAAWSVGANETAGATAELVKIDGCTLVFQIEAHVEKEPIGSGSHKRVVVNVARFDQRIQKKLGA